MARRSMLVLVLLVCTNGFAGCASNRSGRDSDSELDRLWRQGYGFKNPNVKNIRQGKPTVGFDGK